MLQTLLQRHLGPTRTRQLFASVAGLTAGATMLTGCVATQLPPISATGATFAPLADEREIWFEAQAEEEQLLEEAWIYDDPLLVEYLEDVVAGLNPPTMAANPEIRYRVVVLEDPTLNAFAYPHGSIYIHTGLLAQMENEAQLATVLGHEMSHVENRHMVRYRRSIHNKEVTLAVVSVAAAVILANEQADAWHRGDYGDAHRIGILGELLVHLGLNLAFVASVNGYGRDLELEADEGAFAKLQARGYDLREAPKIYEGLRDNHGQRGDLEVFFFGSHPRLGKRVTHATKWVAARPEEPEEPFIGDQERFERRIFPVIRDDARLNLNLGRLALARLELERVLPALRDDAETHFLLARLELAEADEAGEAAERRRLERRAHESLREAVRLHPEHADAHLELALLAYRGEDWRTACIEFRLFDELVPDAEDIGVHEYLLELEHSGHCPQETR